MIKGRRKRERGKRKNPLPGRPRAVCQACPLSSVSARPSPGFRVLLGGRSGRVGSDAGMNFGKEFGNLEFGIVLAPRCFVRGIEASHWVLVCTPKIPEALAAARCAGGPEEGSGYRCARFWMGMASRARRGKKIETRPHSSARTDAIVAEPGVGQFQNPTVDERAGRRLR